MIEAFSQAWHQAYLEMKADPTDHTTGKDFCTQYGIDVGTLSRWRTKNAYAINYEIDKRRKAYVARIRAKAWKALDKKIDKGSDKAIELTFKLIGDFVERSEQKIDYMRPEDKIARIKELLSQIPDKKTLPEGTVEPQVGGDRSDEGPRPA